MPSVIDINRGVTQRSYKDRMISMYKDDPGVYLFPDGSDAGEEIAEKAGFPVKEHGAVRRKKELEREARARAEKQFNDEMAESTVEVDGEQVVVGAGPANEVIRSTGKEEPRETRSRLMAWAGPVVCWKVTDKLNGEVLYEGSDTAEAERILQGGD